MSKICKNCGATLDDGAAFCFQCKHDPDEVWSQEEDQKAREKGRRNSKIVVIVSVILIAALAAGLVFGLVRCVQTEDLKNFARSKFKQAYHKIEKEISFVHGHIEYSDAELEEELSGDLDVTLDKVVLTDDDHKMFTIGEASGRLASTADECKYIIHYEGGEYVANDYFRNTATGKLVDRVTVTTVVYVVDVKEKKIIHVHAVGVDAPSETVVTKENKNKAALKGEVQDDKAKEYIAELLTQHGG